MANDCCWEAGEDACVQRRLSEYCERDLSAYLDGLGTHDGIAELHVVLLAVHLHQAAELLGQLAPLAQLEVQQTPTRHLVRLVLEQRLRRMTRGGQNVRINEKNGGVFSFSCLAHLEGAQAGGGLVQRVLEQIDVVAQGQGGRHSLRQHRK